MINNSQGQIDSTDDVHSSYIESEQWHYEEVESVISNKDDPTMACCSIRIFLLGLIFVTIQSFINTYLLYRTQVFQFNATHMLLLIYPVGITVTRLTSEQSLTIKEHVLLFMMTTTTSATNLSLNIFDVQRIYSLPETHSVLAVLFISACALVPIGLAGTLRRCLIWPSEMIWPINLQFIAIFRILHDSTVDGYIPIASWWPLRRLHFFVLITCVQFIYQWLPSYCMPILGGFAWLCMIQPTNRLLSQLTGPNGFAFAGSSLSFDWVKLVDYLGSPVVIPRWAQVNIFIGLVLIVWVAGPLIFFLNLWDVGNLPIRDPALFSNQTWQPIQDYVWFHNQSVQLVPSNISISKFRFTTSTVLQDATSFMILPALFTHTILYHRSFIWKNIFKSFHKRSNDIHCTLSKAYPETPDWCFFLLSFMSLIVLLFVCHYGELLSWYLTLLAVLLGAAWILLVAIPFGQTGLHLNLSYFLQIMLAIQLTLKKPLSNAVFREINGIILSQTLYFLLILKLGHYMHISPRAMFGSVISSIVVSSITVYCTSKWIWASTPDLCFGNPTWTCRYQLSASRSFITATEWGPNSYYGSEAILHPLLWCIPIGAVLPIPFYLLARRCSNNVWLKYVHIPIILSVGDLWKVRSAANLFSWLLLGLMCSFALCRWWYSRYALVLSAAMSVGGLLTKTIIHFSLIDRNITMPIWWGIGGRTGDGCPLASASHLQQTFWDSRE